ncbi:hypothetical protein [Streptomyces sp. NPDC058653]|uniref:hypothetical protein n=1 Tax=Streptomyces sp. NPDC058653 TaxID=3346576 RepID=UPI00364DE065
MLLDSFLKQIPDDIQRIILNSPDPHGPDQVDRFTTHTQYVYPLVQPDGKPTETVLASFESADVDPPALINPQAGDIVELTGVPVLVTEVEEQEQPDDEDSRLITWRTAVVHEIHPLSRELPN